MTAPAPPMHDPDDYVGIQEFARMCGVSVSTIRRYERQGRVSAARLPGGQRRFRRGDVAAVFQQ